MIWYYGSFVVWFGCVEWHKFVNKMKGWISKNWILIFFFLSRVFSRLCKIVRSFRNILMLVTFMLLRLNCLTEIYKTLKKQFLVFETTKFKHLFYKKICLPSEKYSYLSRFPVSWRSPSFMKCKEQKSCALSLTLKLFLNIF